jgi:hypothetical protein
MAVAYFMISGPGVDGWLAFGAALPSGFCACGGAAGFSAGSGGGMYSGPFKPQAGNRAMLKNNAIMRGNEFMLNG